MRATIAPKTHELIQFPWCLLRWGPRNRWRCRWRRRPLGKGGSWHHQQGKSRPRRDDPLPCVILGLCFEVTRRLPFRFGLRPQTLPQDSASRENTYILRSSASLRLAELQCSYILCLQSFHRCCSIHQLADPHLQLQPFHPVSAARFALFEPMVRALHTSTPAATWITVSDPPTRNLGMMGKSSSCRKLKRSIIFLCQNLSHTSASHAFANHVQAWTTT